MATTQCPQCSVLVKHRADFVVAVAQRETDGGVRTRLIANDTIALHACDSVDHNSRLVPITSSMSTV